MFPHATQLFHVLKAIDRHLKGLGLSSCFQQEIYEVFRETVYTYSIDTFIRLQEYLCVLDKK